MPTPILHPTDIRVERYAGVVYHVEGSIVPVLRVEVRDVALYFENHVVLWKDAGLTLERISMEGAIRRMMGGMPVFLMNTSGAGTIAFSRYGAGQVLPLHLAKGEAIHVREHQFMAATETIAYDYERSGGVGGMLFGDTGVFVDLFTADEDGILWIYGYGNVFQVELKAGESIDVEPGSWIYRSADIGVSLQTQNLGANFLAGGGSVFYTRFTGPGTVGLQSMSATAPGAAEAAPTGGKSIAERGARGVADAILDQVLDRRR